MESDKDINNNEIDFIEYICRKLPEILRAIQKEQKDGYIYHSPNRASFDRLRLEMNKTLMRIRNKIYK